MQFDDEIKEIVDERIGMDNVVLLAYRGSIAHNMYIPESNPNSIDDVDIIAVHIRKAEYYLGLNTNLEKGKDIKVGKYDFAIYELKKFIYLLYKSNPNVMSLLWLNDDHYIHISAIGSRLLNERDIFMSKKVFHTFAGYANGQLKRMTHLQFKGYMGEKRKKLVEKYGYDTKNAAHLIRLLVMGKEALETGKFKVFRDDADRFLQIKRGEWSLERVKEESDRLFEELHTAYTNSTLPESPDKEEIDKMLVSILLNHILSRVVRLKTY